MSADGGFADMIEIVAPGTITRAAPKEPGKNYVALNAEGTHLVQGLSGLIWTNFNYSDPGVTILEQLCYALTELSYRADFRVADLLGAPSNGVVMLPRQGLYPAHAIMPVNPVTAADLRRLVIDRVAGVANAWFTPLPRDKAGGVSGLYQIQVLAAGLMDPCCAADGLEPEKLRGQVLDVYAAHRALCEDVAELQILRPLHTVVCADVQLDNGADPDQVMARLLFNLGLTLAPEPRRSSLDALRLSGMTTSEIFQGPAMRRGFILDDQLTPFPRQIQVEDLTAVMAETVGAQSVDSLSVQVQVQGTSDPYGPGAVIDVPDGHILWLETEPRAGQFSIRLMHGGVVCRPNPVRVRRLLDRAWAEQRQCYDLLSAYVRDYPTPIGAGGDLAEYVSVQTQFPAVYGIGVYGLPGGVAPMRAAQAKQLKGYLMVFDQLMADFFSQIAFIRDLFSIGAGGDRTYACQSLAGIVPDVAPLLRPGYEADLRRLIAANDPVLARQNMFIDFLLSLYAESLAQPIHFDCQGADGKPPPRGALLRAKQALLARMEPASRDRGRGFDYRRGAPLRDNAGLDVRCRIELALLDAGRHGAPEPVADPAEASFGRPLAPAVGALVEQTFLPVEARDHGGDEDWDAAGQPLSGQTVAAVLLPALADPTRYRVGDLRRDGGLSLVCQATDDSWWRLAGCRDAAEAVALTEVLVQSTGGDFRRLYLVEWTLLRHATHRWREDASTRHLLDPYSFRISAVLPTRQTEDDDHAWRKAARGILRENMPAHVEVDDLFLGPRQMKRFRRLYDAWLAALRRGHEQRLAEASWNLALFLHRRGAPGPGKAVAEQETQVEAEPDPDADDTARTAADAPSDADTEATGDTAPDAEAVGDPEPESEPEFDPEPEPAASPMAIRPPDLPGVAGPATVGALGFDADTRLSPARAAAFAAAGFRFAVRRLSAEAMETPGDLTAAEARDILMAGLALMAVQAAPSMDAPPDAARGETEGALVAAKARAAGLPAGMTLWLDLDGLTTVAPDEVAAYAGAWAEAVSAAAFQPGLHVGAAALTTISASARSLPFSRYWQSAGSAPVQPTRGCCLIQTVRGGPVEGVGYGADRIQADLLGDTPIWLAPTPAARESLAGGGLGAVVRSLLRRNRSEGEAP